MKRGSTRKHHALLLRYATTRIVRFTHFASSARNCELCWLCGTSVFERRDFEKRETRENMGVHDERE